MRECQAQQAVRCPLRNSKMKNSSSFLMGVSSGVNKQINGCAQRAIIFSLISYFIFKSASASMITTDYGRWTVVFYLGIIQVQSSISKSID